MLGRIAAFFSAPADAGADDLPADETRVGELIERMAVLDRDPYLHIADRSLKLLSVFDDLKYDRADGDWMSPAMRKHAIQKLAPLGFRQISGTVLENKDANVRFLIPKFHAQGASPFDITRYTAKRAQDFYLLTPTQTACQFIDNYSKDEAVARIKDMIVKHPINLYRLMDYLEKKPAHEAFADAIGHLKYVQREAVESEPLCRRRSLGSFMI